VLKKTIKSNLKTFTLNIKGIVQGVGFRPFIWHTARKLGLNGIVTNTTEGVFVKINAGSETELLDFIRLIEKEKPAPAVIEKIEYKEIDYEDFDNLDDFIITKSIETSEKFQLISPDLATCSSCVYDINDNKNHRRFNYPFTNCTNCGPRFTIIKRMPYDRVNTTMAKFKQCPACQDEYDNPLDRRFHAQPNACIKCGPKILLLNNKGKIIDENEPIISAAILIQKGKIIGLKSLGGFQIACDATNDSAVAELRNRKGRLIKPFALMFKDINSVKDYLLVSKKEEQSLTSPAAPIVLLSKKNFRVENNFISNINSCSSNTSYINSVFEYSKNIKNIKNMENTIWNNISIDGKDNISFFVSFYNRYEGALLPYTPIHYILFKNLDIPLVMTSGNISEEPIASDNDEALEKLSYICDYFLIHDRDIYSKYDDSVIKIFDGKEMIIRRARGYAPYPLKLNIDIGNKVILAVGAQEKNTFCLLTKNYAISSQHIGDLDSIESLKFFKSTLKNYKKLFGIENVDIVVYDKHPDYISTRFAERNFKKAEKIEVQHHKAHIAGVIAENMLLDEINYKNGSDNVNRPGTKEKLSGVKNTVNFIEKKSPEKILGFAWDGTGYGDDGKIWGSEIFTVDSSMIFTRVGHLQEKCLPGGEITIKKPCRMTLVYLYKLWNGYNKNSLSSPDMKADSLSVIFRKALKTNDNKKAAPLKFSEFVLKILPFYEKVIFPVEIDIIKSQIDTGYNSPLTTSMGRLFDAVSSLLNLTHLSSYEGEAAVHLEMIADNKCSKSYRIRFKIFFNQKTGSNNSSNNSCDKSAGNKSRSGSAAIKSSSQSNDIMNSSSYSINTDNISINDKFSASSKNNACCKTINSLTEMDNLDFSEDIYFIIDDYYIFNQILQDLKNNIPESKISAKFHNTLAKVILYSAVLMRKIHKINTVVLSGGVFQNNLLIKRSFKILRSNKFEVFSKFKVPVNDGGISLGQAYMAACNFLKNH